MHAINSRVVVANSVFESEVFGLGYPNLKLIQHTYNFTVGF